MSSIKRHNKYAIRIKQEYLKLNIKLKLIKKGYEI